mgnify:CR=1 FL=1
MRWGLRFTFERISLFNAEAMLLIDDDQPEIAECHIGLDQRMRPNHQYGLMGGKPALCGLSFLGAPWSEQALLAYGYAYEQASHARVPPTAYKQPVVK